MKQLKDFRNFIGYQLKAGYVKKLELVLSDLFYSNCW